MTTPDLNDYTVIAQQGRMTPVYRVALADWETPVSAFYKTAAHEPYAFLLESVTGGEQIARYSYIGFAPTLILRTKGRTARVWERESGWRAFEIPPPQTPLDIARELLHRYPYQASPALPRFTGGLVGYLSYDLVRFFERLPDAPPDDLHTDDCCLIAPEVLLIFDHAMHTITILTNPSPSASPEQSYAEAVGRIEQTLQRLRTPMPPPPLYNDPHFRRDQAAVVGVQVIGWRGGQPLKKAHEVVAEIADQPAREARQRRRRLVRVSAQQRAGDVQRRLRGRDVEGAPARLALPHARGAPFGAQDQRRRETDVRVAGNLLAARDALQQERIRLVDGGLVEGGDGRLPVSKRDTIHGRHLPLPRDGDILSLVWRGHVVGSNSTRHRLRESISRDRAW